MQQLIQELRSPTSYIESTDADGTVTVKRNAPTSLNLRAASALEKALNVIGGLERNLHQLTSYNEQLFNDIKLLKEKQNANINSGPVSDTTTQTHNQSTGESSNPGENGSDPRETST